MYKGKIKNLLFILKKIMIIDLTQKSKSILFVVIIILKYPLDVIKLLKYYKHDIINWIRRIVLYLIYQRKLWKDLQLRKRIWRKEQIGILQNNFKIKHMTYLKLSKHRLLQRLLIRM